MQETIRFTPFELVFGRPVTTTLDAMLPVDNDVVTGTEVDEFTQKLKKLVSLQDFAPASDKKSTPGNIT